MGMPRCASKGIELSPDHAIHGHEWPMLGLLMSCNLTMALAQWHNGNGTMALRAWCVRFQGNSRGCQAGAVLLVMDG